MTTHDFWHNPCNLFSTPMHDMKSETKQPVLIRSQYGEQRMEIVTLMWVGFFTGILLGGVTILMP